MERLCNAFGPGYVLVTDSQEVDAILVDIGVPEVERADYGCLFVLYCDNALVEVWGSSSNVPWVWCAFVKVWGLVGGLVEG